VLGHVIAYLVVITVSLLTAYAMGKPVEERRDKRHELTEVEERKRNAHDDSEAPE
jgi:hypothetical protein